MNKAKHVLVVLVAVASVLGVLATAPPADAVGVTYYIDSVEGSDANPGTSPTAPWRSLRIVGDGASPVSNGDTILLRRGRAWNDTIFVNDDGITIDAYGTGPNPTIDSSVPVTSWVPVGPGIFASPPFVMTEPFRQGLGNISQNGRLMSLSDPAAATATVADLADAPVGSYVHDYATKIIYIKPDVPDPNAPGMTYTASTLQYGIQAKVGGGTGTRSDVSISNLHITRYSLMGVELYSCLRCKVTKSEFSDGGGAILTPAPTIYAGNAVQFVGSSSQGLAEDLVITNTFDSAISPQVFDSNNQISDITIRRSRIDRSGFSGVEIAALASAGAATKFSNIRMEDLLITNSGRGWSGNRYANKVNFLSTASGISVTANEGTGSMEGISVARTRILDSVGKGIRLEGNIGTVAVDRVQTSRNDIGVWAFGDATDDTNLGLLLTSSIIDGNRAAGVLYDVPPGAGLELSHNTFYDNAANLQIRGQGGHARLRNNVFASSSDRPQIFVDNYPGDKGLLGDVVVDHNCYSLTTGVATPDADAMVTLEVVRDGATHRTYRQLDGTAGFTTLTGHEEHGVDRARTARDSTGLGLKSPASGDFRLGPRSACRGIGAPTTGVVYDYFGRPFKSAPSAGAIES